MGLDIRPDEVSQAGSSLQELTEAAKRRVTSLFDTTETALAAHPGWECTRALDICRTTYHSRLLGLITKTSIAANNLVITATNVSDKDAEAMERFRGVLIVLGNT
jgi:hypothetical protein